MSISDSLIRGNAAAAVASGIAAAARANGVVQHPLRLTITNSTIADNTAGPGGGIYFDGDQLTVTNSTITGNTAHQGQGGGLFVASRAGPALVTNTDIVANVVPDLAGAGAGVAGPASLLNTLVAHNHGLTSTGSTSTEANCGPGVLSRGHNLDGGTSCPFSAAGDLRQTNPRLAPPASMAAARPPSPCCPAARRSTPAPTPAARARTSAACPAQRMATPTAPLSATSAPTKSRNGARAAVQR